MKFGFAVVPTDATNLPDSVWFTGTVFGTGGDSDALTDVYEKLTALAEPEDDWQYLQKVHGEVYGTGFMNTVKRTMIYLSVGISTAK